jgi:hypothetical protein
MQLLKVGSWKDGFRQASVLKVISYMASFFGMLLSCIESSLQLYHTVSRLHVVIECKSKVS